MSKGSVITFYSYKGGVGRTFTLANVAALLSLWGYKVLCIDWDLEAPGLHLYFKPWMTKKDSYGLLELIQAYVDGLEPDWQDFLMEVAIPGSPQSLFLMQAGSLDATYVQRMQTLDWNLLYEEHQLGDFVEWLREAWKDNFDFILIDSRTGITDTGSICTVQLPDILMLILTANSQSLDGSLDTLERIQARRATFPLDRAKLLVVPIVSRFERRVEYALADRWLARFAEVFPAMYSDWAHKDVTASDLLNFLRVPYVPIWNFGEEIPAITKGTSDVDDIGYSLETIAALVAHNLAATDVLTQSRDKYILAARTAVSQQLLQAERLKTGIKVFISYSYRDVRYMQELRAHLRPLERQGFIVTWGDRRVSGGQSWTETINRELEQANIILMLVSSDYLASDYIYEREIRLALELHETGRAIVIPIILRPTDWMSSPLARLPALPKGAVSISQYRDRDLAWVDVVTGIRQIIDTLRDKTR